MQYLVISAVVLIIFVLLRFVKQTVISGIGYKSKLSIQNLDTWNEGNKYCSNIMILGSTISIVLWGILFSAGSKMIALSFAIIILSFIVSCVFTEMHLRKIFNKDGSRK